MYYYSYHVVVINVVSGQEHTVTVGSLSHDGNIITMDQTYILAGYTIPCNGTVVAWEFCYRTLGGSVTFYPGIWRMSGARGMGNTDYALIQRNRVTYDQFITTGGDNSCQRINLSITDQFTAPAESVVGLYSNVGLQLLHTNTDSSITTYKFSGNQSSINNAGNNDDVDYNIAIRVHLGKTGIYVHSLIAKLSYCTGAHFCVVRPSERIRGPDAHRSFLCI